VYDSCHENTVRELHRVAQETIASYQHVVFSPHHAWPETSKDEPLAYLHEHGWPQASSLGGAIMLVLENSKACGAQYRATIPFQEQLFFVTGDDNFLAPSSVFYTVGADTLTTLNATVLNFEQARLTGRVILARAILPSSALNPVFSLV
jgi:hypothetical protein